MANFLIQGQTTQDSSVPVSSKIELIRDLMLIYILSKFGADCLIFVDAKVNKKIVDGRTDTDGQLSDHNSSLSTPWPHELKCNCFVNLSYLSIKNLNFNCCVCRSNKYTVVTPERKQHINQRSNLQPRAQRDNSNESRQSSHHSSRHSTHYSSSFDRENLRPNSAPIMHQYVNTPEHLVYGNKLITDTNWVLSSKPNRIPRYTRRKDTVMNRDSYPMHVRNTSAGRQEISRSRFGNYGKDNSAKNGGVSRYVRSRSYSPHRNALSVNRIHQDDHVIQAIQMGLEKRQRAIRLSLYQMPEPRDYEWEIN